MFFIASKILWILVRPLSLIVLLFLLALLALALGRPRASALFLVLALGGYVTIEHTTLGETLLRPLENRYSQPAPMPQHVTGIIVLGGAVGAGFMSEQRPDIPLNDAAERMTRAVELARLYPQARLVFSGHSGSLVSTGASESDVARRFFLSQGIPADRMMFEDKSRNTSENALFSAEIIPHQPDETWLLVTSAYHMPRAVGCFAHAGWPVVPFPVDYNALPDSNDGWFMAGDGTRLFSLAVREWIGLAAYRLSGKIPAIW